MRKKEKVALLGENHEARLNFDLHPNKLLKKPSKKYHALERVCNHMNKKKRHIFANAFIASQFYLLPSCSDVP